MSGPERITSVGLFGNPQKERIHDAIAVVREICGAAGVEVRWTRDLARLLGDESTSTSDAEMIAATQVIIALGGDGTMLRAARIIDAAGVPLLGINLGSLGFLTDVPLAELPLAMQRMLDGEFHLERRHRIGCTVWRGAGIIAEESGLNDITVNMGPLPRTLLLELRIDGVSLGRFLGDGVIFATATGSTAYSLSAGGAICQPHLPVLLVTPICPHSLGMRPLILGGEIEVELVLHEVGNGATLTADGQVPHHLLSGDRLVCQVTPPVVNLVKFPNSSFFRVLRQKLNWGAHPRARRYAQRVAAAEEPA